MALNLILGIGGTGAKIVEAVLHSCAAGLGPDRLHVGFVDQDRSNGNVSRALETMTTIREARENWRRPGGPHYFPDGDLLRTEVVPIGEALWVPHPNQRTSLSEILGDIGEDKRLFDLLFAPGPREQTMELDEGYRGRAHVGAAAITTAARAESRRSDPFWQEVFGLIRQAEGGETVRLVLAGSVFGGTGAAGFPTLARLIRRFIQEENIGLNFAMGGVLMLPYFRFDPPADESANVARPEDLLPQTRGALRYYDSLLKREGNLFDELLMVGWDTSFNLGYHRQGTGDQRNPALVPELIAAMGACRFIDADHKPSRGVLATARESADSIDWNDVPSPVAEPDAPYRKLGKQLRFAATWKHWAPILAKEPTAWRNSFRRHAWFKRFALDRIDYDQASPRETIQSLTRYVDDFIEWAAAMQVYASQAALRFGLWDVQSLLTGAADYDNPQHPVALRPQLGEAEYGAASRSVLAARLASHRLTDGAWLLERLNRGRSPEGAAGLGGLIAALHAASAATDPQRGSSANAGL